MQEGFTQFNIVRQNCTTKSLHNRTACWKHAGVGWGGHQWARTSVPSSEKGNSQKYTIKGTCGERQGRRAKHKRKDMIAHIPSRRKAATAREFRNYDMTVGHTDERHPHTMHAEALIHICIVDSVLSTTCDMYRLGSLASGVSKSRHADGTCVWQTALARLRNALNTKPNLILKKHMSAQLKRQSFDKQNKRSNFAVIPEG